MKALTLIQAGALLLLAVIGAYASTDAPAACTTEQTEVCDI